MINQNDQMVNHPLNTSVPEVVMPPTATPEAATPPAATPETTPQPAPNQPLPQTVPPEEQAPAFIPSTTPANQPVELEPIDEPVNTGPSEPSPLESAFRRVVEELGNHYGQGFRDEVLFLLGDRPNDSP